MSADALRIAQNVARNCGYHVFPCLEDKRPATPHGFKDARVDPEAIASLWRRHPGSLVAIVAGERSGVSILDIDVKHPEACAWWQKYVRHLPMTRTYRTRSGGLHMYFKHQPGIINSEGKPVKGIDVRGEGGYVVYWFAAGFECLDHSQPAAWPRWLSEVIWPPPPPRRQSKLIAGDQIDGELERVRKVAIQKVEQAGSGNLHVTIRAASRLLGGIQASARFSDSDATSWLMSAGGLKDERKAEKTIAWGLEKGRGEPLELRGR